MNQSELYKKIAEDNELSPKQVKGVFGTLEGIAHSSLKKEGEFKLPGFAKFVVVKKPATKEHKGISPFSGEEVVFKAKPARNIIKARPVKAIKDALA